MDHRVLVDRTLALGGFDDPERAERIIEAVLETLGERMPPDQAEAVAAELPHPLADWILRRRVPGSFSLEELYDRVGRRAAVRSSFALEQTQVVCEAFAEVFPGAATAARVGLSVELARLLERHDRSGIRPTRPSPLGPEHPYSHSLATGRPGSTHPLSEARPERAHAQSVARSENPHGDTKLSSSSGLRQQRLGESLATGKPGSSRPISG